VQLDKVVPDDHWGDFRGASAGGAGGVFVRDWMGHASVQQTEGYLHRSTASHSKAVANLDAYVTA
jgi:integrase